MRRFVALAALLLTTVVAPARAATDPRQVKVGWTRLAAGLSGPVALSHPPGDPRLFVVERPGRIRVIRNGVMKATPFLDVSRLVNTSGEGGLLSVAFKPDYATSGLFFVAFTDASMTLRIVRYHADPTADVASPTGVSVLGVPHPTNTNHNGGQLAFGPGGYLFAGTGDGGGAGDPNGNAQNLGSLLGKILRLDITHKATGKQYSIPTGNPFVGRSGARGEIWLYGLRNPWRFSFDRGHPDLWIGDVGQADREEVDKVRTGGLNMGWDCREGTLDTVSQYGGTYCTGSGYTAPIYEYTHDSGCAIIGGYVYRGTTYSSLVGGAYVFGDYCSGNIWMLGHDSTGARVVGLLNTFGGNILAFGRDVNGEVYLLSEGGALYHLWFAHR
jgi:glucose/arabinose dehydrogenase